VCEYLDYRVIKLRRVRIMNVKLDVPIGKWRNLTTKELDFINNSVVDSKKNFE